MLKIRKTRSRICSLSMVCLAQFINYFSSILIELPSGQMVSFSILSEEKPIKNIFRMHRIVGINCGKFRFGNSAALLIPKRSNGNLTTNQNDRVTRLLNGILEGNRASLSQSITLVESKNHNKEHFHV